jgi:cobalt-precorrin-5B (C1)-methyltransferase
MERYIEKNNKKLRYGYTTGSCAAAAAKAAVQALYGKKVSVIDIDTPKGWNISIDVFHNKCPKGAHCYVIKDAGDDPDVTDGIKIHAFARKSQGTESIRIQAGIGIGIVTKKGLSIDVGEPAINPVPLQMIRKEVEKVLPSQESVTISIFVPEGLEIAKRTFNEKLGILGGISILGTTGIVEPMSEKALLDTFKIELSILRASGKKELIFVFGNFGRDYLKQYNIPEKNMQKTSNFIGPMVEEATRLGFNQVLLVGHIGKIVKVAYEMHNTHSQFGDHRMASIYQSALSVGISKESCKDLLECNTTDEAIEYLDSLSRDLRDRVCQSIVSRCKTAMETWAGHQIKVECIMFSKIHGELGHTEEAFEMLKELKK